MTFDLVIISLIFNTDHRRRKEFFNVICFWCDSSTATGGSKSGAVAGLQSKATFTLFVVGLILTTNGAINMFFGAIGMRDRNEEIEAQKAKISGAIEKKAGEEIRKGLMASITAV